MPTAPTIQQRDWALDRLRVLTAVQAIRDPELNQSLAPFRGHPPTAFLCGNALCLEPILWCALDLTTARVRFGGAAPADRPDGSRRPAPYDSWAPDEEIGVSIAPPGEPMLRWRFRCDRCDRACVLTNGRMITLLLRALASGRAAIRPAAE
ncbi:MAG: hypothetical protein ACR2KV_16835 [Solirubrobacteraceae bacterium]